MNLFPEETSLYSWGKGVQTNHGESMKKTLVAITRHVNSPIPLLRSQKLILDSDLAELYGVPVKRLNEQIKRNRARFPIGLRVSSQSAGRKTFEAKLAELEQRLENHDEKIEDLVLAIGN
jgi:hypothetical protein